MMQARKFKSVAVLIAVVALVPTQPYLFAADSSVSNSPPSYTEAVEAANNFYAKGILEQKKGNHVQAIQDFDSAILAKPKNPEAIVGRAGSYLALNDPLRAIADYSEAIRLNPDLADAYFGRANAYQMQGNFDLALIDCDRAIALNAYNPDAFNMRGNIYRFQEKYELALKDYGRVLSLYPDYAGAYYGRALVYIALRQLNRAAADLNRALLIRPELEIAKEELRRLNRERIERYSQ